MTVAGLASTAKGKAANQAQVAVARGNDLYAMTRQVLDTMGGIGKVIHPGESVFIKPNMVRLPWAKDVNPFVTGECTKPEIVIALAEECLRAGASKIIIGDGSQMPKFSWVHARTLDGSTNLVKEAKRLRARYKKPVQLACLEVDSPGWVDVPTDSPIGKISISTLVTEADRVISVPVMKTHRWARLSLSLKNFYGIVALRKYGWTEGIPADGVTGATTKWKLAPQYDRAQVHNKDSSPHGIARNYFAIAKAIRPDLAIIDGSIGVESNGPTLAHGGKTLNVKERLGSWLLLASTDLMAADATAARVMNHDAYFVDQVLAKGNGEGLGVTQEDSIEILGDRLTDLRMDWKPAFPP